MGMELVSVQASSECSRARATHCSRSSGDVQAFECDGAACNEDDPPRILAIEDGLPGILRSNRDVLADL